MTWTLSLAVASAGVGAAKLGAADTPQLVGFFPAVDRAMAFAAKGEAARLPDSVLLLVPGSLSDHDLKWYLGEIVIAGVPADKTTVTLIPDVLADSYGAPVVLADASWKKIVTADGVVTDLAPHYLDDLPAGTTLVLAGHPTEREKVDATGPGTVHLDFPQIAALAFGPAGRDPLPSPHDEPAPANPGSPAALKIGLLVLAVIVVVLALWALV